MQGQTDKVLMDKKEIFSLMNFNKGMFDKFQNDGDDFFENQTYEEFLAKQWEQLVNITDVDYINTIKYIVTHRNQFSIVNKGEISFYDSDGYIFNAIGSFCLSHDNY